MGRVKELEVDLRLARSISRSDELDVMVPKKLSVPGFLEKDLVGYERGFNDAVDEFVNLNLENSSQSVVEIDEAVRGNKLAEYSLKTLRIQYARYEFVRTLTPRQFKDLWERHTSGGGRFDDLVDAAIIDRKDWTK